MRNTLYLSAVAVLALSGCATDATDAPDDATGSPSATPESPAASASPTPADGDVAAMEFATCEAPEFSIGHPAAWETNQPGDLVAACRVFHPGPIELPDEPRDADLHWAAQLDIDDAPYEDVALAEPSGELLAELQMTLAGRDVRVTEVRADDEALVPEGELSYRYAVDLDGRTLIASTSSVGETDYERDKVVLDRMMVELELATGGGS